MPIEQGYQEQLAPSAAPMMPGGSAIAEGAGIGQALQQAGEVVHEKALQTFRVQRKLIADSELSIAEKNFAEYRMQMTDFVRTSRDSAGPGGAGHTATVDQANAAGRAKVLDGITDPAVAQHMAQQWDEWSATLHSSEAGWEEGQRVNRMVDDTGEANNLSGNLIRNSGGNQDTYKQELGIRFKAIAALNVNDDVKEKLYRDAENQAGVGFLLGLRDKDPHAAQAALDSGAFNFLPADTVDKLRNGNEVEIRRIAAQQEHAQAQARAQANDAIATLEEKFHNGIEVADSDFAQAIGMATTLGDKSKVESLTQMRADNQFAHVYSGQPPLVRQNRVAELSGMAKRTEAQDRELKWLNEHRETLDSQFHSDSMGFAIQHSAPGMGPPAGDVLGDPNALGARAKWWQGSKASYGGQLDLFTKAEADQANQVRHSGPQGAQQVLGTLDQLPVEARIAAARQLAPSDSPEDSLFRHLAFINPDARQVMFAGQQAMGKNAELFTAGPKYSPGHVAMRGYDDQAQGAMRMVSPADYQATQTLARYYVAGYMHRMGWTSIEQVPPNIWERAYRQALGGGVLPNGRGAVGGLAGWGDGLYMLPSRQNSTTFAQALLADSQARKIHPVNPDGSFFDVRYATPVFIGLDPKQPNVWLYRFETKDRRVVKSSGGGDYVARIPEG